MNTLKLALTALHRDRRSGELRLIGIAIITAVASLTSVGFFTDRVRQATETQATELLAADLVLQSRQPVPARVIEDARAAGLIFTNVTSLRSMVVARDQVQLAEVKAVANGYPIRGRVRTSPSLFGAETAEDDIPEPGTAWVDSRLFQLLGIAIGDRISLGNTELSVAKIITYEPDRGGDMFTIAPRLMMNLKDLPATNLILPASRVDYSLLLGGDAVSIADFRASLDDNRGLRAQGIRDARPELRSALERAEQFLGLAALVSIALAGLAVAMSAQRYAARHFDTCAIMRCLGAEQRTITTLYFTQLMLLAVVCSLLGCAAGFVAQEALAALLAGMTNRELPTASFMPVLTGLTAGVVTVLGFAMPQVIRLRNVTSLRVLRRDLNPLPAGSTASYGTAVVALALLTPWQYGNHLLTAYTFLGILLTGVLLTCGAMLLIRLIDRQLRTRVGVAWRFGLANIARRANASIAQILAIGLGVMVMLLLTLVRTDLLDSWRNRVPPGTPNYFLINIQSEDITRLEAFLKTNGDIPARFYPMVRARLVAINGQRIDPDAYSGEEGRRWARRGYNLTWAEQLPAANIITNGRWWTAADAGQPLFSLEQQIQEELGVSVDGTLTFEIAGREVTGRIASTRRVDWDSFNVNFFVVASPGALHGQPASYVTSIYLSPGGKHLVIDLVKNFPSVTVYDVDALLTEVRRIMDQVVRTVEFVFLFTLLAGIIVLLAALQTTHDERSYESALMSAIGADRKKILSSLTAEFFCIGLIAGILAAVSATTVEIILARFVFNMDITVNPLVWIIAPLICILVTVTGGLAGTRHALYTPPVVVLRQN